MFAKGAQAARPSGQAKAAPTQAAPSKLKVFISYSRADTAFADELMKGLEYDGLFDVSMDRHAIHEGEAWKERLGALILSADTIVFLLSPNSAASDICRWEVEQAHANSKRILPVLVRPLGDVPAPPLLAALNYVRFDPENDAKPRSFMSGLAALREALRTNLSWLREHTRLLDRANEWDRAGRAANRLLTGEDIAAAKHWLETKPQYAPDPTELHRDLIQASAQAEIDRLSAERQRADVLQGALKRTKRAFAGTIVLAVVSVVAGALAYLKQREAEDAGAFAYAKQLEAEQAQNDLKNKIDQFEKAVAYIRDDAEAKFRSILIKHNIEPAAPRPSVKIDELSDDDLVARISEDAIQAIVAFEVQGRENYNRKYSNPFAPWGGSGVTIGIGYELGYVTKEQFMKDWEALTPRESRDRLATAVGLTSSDARSRVAEFKDIVIPFEIAMQVFSNTTLKKYSRLTNDVFPNSAKAPPDCFGALVSLIYNRGSQLDGDNRKEMFAISRLVELGEYEAVPNQIRAMKWLWEGRNLGGIVKRREAEAVLFESGLAQLKPVADAK